MNTGFVFDRIKNATSKAFDRVGKTAGIPTDPDLKLYQSLQQPDFEKLTQKFGQDNVLQYIQAMESKRLGAVTTGGNNNG